MLSFVARVSHALSDSSEETLQIKLFSKSICFLIKQVASIDDKGLPSFPDSSPVWHDPVAGGKGQYQISQGSII